MDKFCDIVNDAISGYCPVNCADKQEQIFDLCINIVYRNSAGDLLRNLVSNKAVSLFLHLFVCIVANL